ncbi:MAG TPA: SulP family inorganic anion transporter [Polyangiales bacterium]
MPSSDPPPRTFVWQTAAEMRGWADLLPFVRTLRGYGMRELRPDLIAGLTVALFAVPQAMAYALIAGVPPAAGIATAVAAAIFGAAFGSSEFLINGPTNAISVMLAANAALFAAQGDALSAIVTLTLLVGLVQTAAGLLRVGTLTRFVSEPVLTGFTAGAGVYIVINQLPAFLGIEKSALPTQLWGMVPPRCALSDLARLLTRLDRVNLITFGLALLTFLTVRGVQNLEPRLGRRLPAPFFAVVVTSIVVWQSGLDASSGVKLVSDIAPLARSLPPLRWPALDLASVRALLGPAVAIAFMGSVEAIAIGKLLAGRAGHRFDPSRQLIGEAVCNLSAAAVGGFASSGSFSRTAVNFESGAVTRMSCIFSGALVMVLVLMFAPQANAIPIAALAGTLVHIGAKLVDVARLRGMLATTPGDRLVLLATFATVLLAEHLENALLVGVVLSIYSALRRAEGFKLRELIEGPEGTLVEGSASAPRPIAVLNLQGELFFAAADELAAELTRMFGSGARVIVLRVQEAYNLDATTAHAIAHVADEARRRGGRLLLCGVRPGMLGTLERAGLAERIGVDALFPAEAELLASTHRALEYAHRLVADRSL